MVVDFPVKAVADRLGYQSALWARGFVDLLNIKEKFLSVNGYLALFPGNLFFFLNTVHHSFKACIHIWHKEHIKCQSLIRMFKSQGNRPLH